MAAYLRHFRKFGPSTFPSVAKRFGIVKPDDGTLDDATPLLALASAQERIHGEVRRFLAATDELQQNRLLSDEGKLQEHRKLAEKSLAALDRVDDALVAKARRRIGELEKYILARATATNVDPVIGELRGREIRDQLRAMSSAERWEVLKRALDSRDAEVLGAIARAPRIGAPLVEERSFEKVLRVYRRSLSPAEADELDQLQQVYDAVSAELTALREDLRENAEPPRDLAARLRTPAAEPALHPARQEGEAFPPAASPIIPPADTRRKNFEVIPL